MPTMELTAVTMPIWAASIPTLCKNTVRYPSAAIDVPYPINSSAESVKDRDVCFSETKA